jgi:hypothetical protein
VCLLLLTWKAPCSRWSLSRDPRTLSGIQWHLFLNHPPIHSLTSSSTESLLWIITVLVAEIRTQHWGFTLLGGSPGRQLRVMFKNYESLSSKPKEKLCQIPFVLIYKTWWGNEKCLSFA